MKAFISHNRADKDVARSMAAALVCQGINVWYDEWDLRPGDSIVGGIEAGLADCDLLVVVWSAAAANSKWVGTELRAYLRRRVDDDSLRIVPIMIDDTELPVLLAEYLGFKLDDTMDFDDIAIRITGNPADVVVAGLLQKRLLRLMEKRAQSGDPFPYLVCPRCGEPNLTFGVVHSEKTDRQYEVVHCPGCGWGDWSE